MPRREPKPGVIWMTRQNFITLKEVTQLENERERYAKAQPVLYMMKKHRKRLTSQQFSTIKGQALAGDIEGAKKGLEKIVGEVWE